MHLSTVNFLINTYLLLIYTWIDDSAQLNTAGLNNNLAPLPKKPSGSTGKSGASLLGKSISGKSGGFGSSINKSSIGSSGKSSTFGSTSSKKNNFGSTTNKASTFVGTSPAKDTSSARAPSFLAASGKTSSGLTPSTSKKTYDTLSYSPKNAKSSTSFGIIWLPGRKRNRKKDLAYSSINYDKKNERTPTMYNVMSGDSPDYQLQKKKDEEAGLLEKVKGPIATAASAGAVTINTDAPSDSAITDPEEKLLKHDQEESKEAAGDANTKEDDYLENNDDSSKIPESKRDKSFDKVDSVYISAPSGIKPPPPQSTTSLSDEDDCVVKCLYYTLQCCDCVLM